LEIIVIGSGGQSRVIADLVAAGGEYAITKFVSMEPKDYPDLRKAGLDAKKFSFQLESQDRMGIIAIGDNFRRYFIAKYIQESFPEFAFITLIHRSSTISPSAKIGRGVFIGAGAVVAAGCVVGDHAIINTNASLDHDSSMGEFSSLGPNSAVAGGCSIGGFSHIGMGASVLQNLSVAESCIVGAGAVVTRNTVPGWKYLGMPARKSGAWLPGQAYLT
jgi:sugar O-acyltransferase (sialic acid O-acetyltransferase NeuD family)